MSGGARRGWLIAALAGAVLVLGGSVAAVAAHVTTASPGHVGAGSGSYGPGMMNRGDGRGMMGAAGPGYGTGGYGTGMMGAGGGMAWGTDGTYGLAGDGRPVTTMEAAKARAQAFADQLGGLHAGEVMRFSNGYYSELLTSDGTGATEVLIDPSTGAVSIEYGPAMMWNTRYGMHATTATATRVSATQATRDAQQWIDAQRPGLTTGAPEAFPGYYTLDTLRDGRTVGMLSVNAITGAVWYHTWHGTYLSTLGG